MNKLIITFAVLVLSACAMPIPVNSAGVQVSAKDSGECDYEASKATASMQTMDKGTVRGELYRQCLALRGFK
jgi:hypothetical protein